MLKRKNLWVYQEATAIGRTFAAMKDYQIDGNKEMVALGVMNVAGSMTSCYVATGKANSSQRNFIILEPSICEVPLDNETKGDNP